jgi:hypothetical protein
MPFVGLSGARAHFGISRVTMETMMIDRHFFGDVGLAVLLAFPTLALARPQATVPKQTAAPAPIVEQAALVERTPVEERYNLPG